MSLLFPFVPDWSASLKVTRTFKTDIITSRAGKEQRRACRNRARKSLEFQITEFNSRSTLFAQTMRQQVASQIYVADYSRSASMVGALVANGAQVELDSSPSWLAGPLVFVNGTTMELRAAPVSFTGNELVLSDRTGNAWDAGTSVYPALLGYLKPMIQGSRPSDNTFTATVEFDVTPTSELVIDPPGAPNAFNSREVLLVRPDWGQTFSIGFGHDFETIDFGQGPVVYNVPIAYAKMTQKVTYLQMSPGDMQLVEDCFTRAKGQRGEFYMPTWVNDLPLAAFANAGSTAFLATGTEAAAVFNGDTVFKDVCVVYYDGTFETAQVQSITASGDNSLVTCTAPFVKAIDPTTVEMICWMPVCRFASDAMTTEWISNTVAQSQLTVVTLEDLNPEVDGWE